MASGDDLRRRVVDQADGDDGGDHAARPREENSLGRSTHANYSDVWCLGQESRDFSPLAKPFLGSTGVEAFLRGDYQEREVGTDQLCRLSRCEELCLRADSSRKILGCAGKPELV